MSELNYFFILAIDDCVVSNCVCCPSMGMELATSILGCDFEASKVV